LTCEGLGRSSTRPAWSGGRRTPARLRPTRTPPTPVFAARSNRRAVGPGPPSARRVDGPKAALSSDDAVGDRRGQVPPTPLAPPHVYPRERYQPDGWSTNSEVDSVPARFIADRRDSSVETLQAVTTRTMMVVPTCARGPSLSVVASLFGAIPCGLGSVHGFGLSLTAPGGDPPCSGIDRLTGRP
jgi:hypothetical protein